MELRHVNIIKSSAGILLTLINDILDFSKIEAGKLELNCIDFEPRKIVEEVVEMLAVKAQGKGLGLFSLIAAGIPVRLRGDPDRLRQVLINLANNAIKFTESGEVVVKIRMEDSDTAKPALRFAVTDSGVGIPADRLDRLFKSFSQVDASTTRQYGGTGLGLAIAKQLVGLMDGEIGVQSTLGRGSTFWFIARFLPAAFSETSAPVIALRSDLGAQPTGHSDGATVDRANGLEDVTVLLAEDNAINQEVASGMLENVGCRVDVVSNGQSAIDALVAKPYDIVLMDCQMPVLDGYDATRQLRLLEKQGGLAAKEVRLPIIALTASAIQGDRQRCLEAGMDRYVTKPIDSNELIGAIKSLLGRTSTVDQNAPCRSRNGESALPIDIGGLVDRCMGDVTLVDEVLNLFALELPKQVKRLTDGLRNQDRAEISNLVHEFKGVAANLSARFLTSRIDELEALIQENGWDSAMAAMGAVEKAVQSCIDFIPQALECVRQPQSKITIA